ncbi:MAG: peptidase domain-containing ABC transporter, partial [Myxococcales bacterium]|nr:peptidase domain-containing ABC transporter [Myxococcales bacterium]
VSGIALEFEPGPEFIKLAPPRGRLVRYARGLLTDRALVRRAALFSTLLLGFSLATPLGTAVIVDELIPAGSVSALGVLLLGIVAVAAFHAVTSILRGRVFVRLQDTVDARMVGDLLGHMIKLPYSFFQHRSAGDLMMRLASTAEVREALTGGAVSAFMDGALVLGYLGLLLFLSPLLALLALLLATLQIGLFLYSRHRRQELTSRYLGAEAASRGFQARMLMGMETLKATGSEGEAARHFHEHFDQVREAARERGRYEATIDGAFGSLRLAGPLGLLAAGAHEVITGAMTLGAMLGAVQLALGFLVPLAALLAAATRLQVALGHVERIDEVFAAELEQDERSRTPAPTLRGAIELRSVSYRHGAALPDVLKEVDLRVEPGQRVAVVGASGSGKSTLARVLLGLCQPTRGAVLHDGVPLTEIELGSLRAQLGVVTQEARLFDMTIAENIALGTPDATPEAIERAAKAARIHEEIVALPMGYKTRLADGGSTLSGGQAQRLTLARALVRAPAVLLLDEATSALDAVTEAAVQAAIAGLSCTVITIAHRLSTVRDADVILVMEDGRIVERGSHDALLAAGGRYRELVDAQLAPADARAVA